MVTITQSKVPLMLWRPFAEIDMYESFKRGVITSLCASTLLENVGCDVCPQTSRIRGWMSEKLPADWGTSTITFLTKPGKKACQKEGLSSFWFYLNLLAKLSCVVLVSPWECRTMVHYPLPRTRALLKQVREGTLEHSEEKFVMVSQCITVKFLQPQI